MKIRQSTSRVQMGSTLLIALIVTGLVGFVLAAYLNLLSAENWSTMRSQAWNASMPVVEAGCEEALEHISVHGKTNLWCDKWNLTTNNQYMMTRWLGNSTFYTVLISNYPNPVVTSFGYVEAPGLSPVASYSTLADAAGSPSEAKTYIVRGVRLTTGHSGLFTKAMSAKGQISMSKTVLTDSYNSADTNYSSNGLYDPAKRRDHGDVASNTNLIDTSGNVSIYGHVSTGPGGNVGLSGNVSIGDTNWVSSKKPGIESGWFRDDMNVSFPDAQVPFSGGTYTPSSGKVGSTNYTYVLDQNVNYQMESLNLSGKQNLLVTGKTKLYVTGKVTMSGQAAIIIAPGGSLELYVGGDTASLSGQGVMNGTGYATNFVYYGLPNNTTVNLSGAAGFAGLIYAPQAKLNLSGGSIIYGATISDSVYGSGGFSFHYDENLANFGSGPYYVTSWNEMTPAELGGAVVTMVPPTK